MPRSLPETMQQFKRVGAEQQTKLLEMGAWRLVQKIFEDTPLSRSVLYIFEAFDFLIY